MYAKSGGFLIESGKHMVTNSRFDFRIQKDVIVLVACSGWSGTDHDL